MFRNIARYARYAQACEQVCAADTFRKNAVKCLYFVTQKMINVSGRSKSRRCPKHVRLRRGRYTPKTSQCGDLPFKTGPAEIGHRLGTRQDTHFRSGAPALSQCWCSGKRNVASLLATAPPRGNISIFCNIESAQKEGGSRPAGRPALACTIFWPNPFEHPPVQH